MGNRVNQRSTPPGVPATTAKKGDERIRIIVADDTRIGCESLKVALMRDRRVEVNGIATTVDQIITFAAASKPHILLLNPSLEDGPNAGLEALSNIVKRLPFIRVVVLLPNGNTHDVVQAFRAGARAVFRRSESLQKLTRCIHAVHHGQIWAASTDLNTTLQAFATAPLVQCVSTNGDKLLTAREQQVVECVAEGLTNREISEQLHVTEHTIKNYLFKIYDKLGVSNRVELVLYGVRHVASARSSTTSE
ncbi:MAG TPA: response regulator transcription factor [Terriglobales bacterium]|nr:response regulator transcription factor [Terriglobales bacterium]